MNTSRIRCANVLTFVGFSLGLLITFPAHGQGKPSKSPFSSVTQRIGISDVTITYSRPGVKGREVWGELVPYNNGIPYPWRAGANETTTISFEHDVLIEGKPLEAGIYGIHMIPSADEWIIIFSYEHEGHGSFEYDEEHDALRIEVTPVEACHEEWLRYGFDDIDVTSATAYLHWEKLKVPFRIEIPRENQGLEPEEE